MPGPGASWRGVASWNESPVMTRKKSCRSRCRYKGLIFRYRIKSFQCRFSIWKRIDASPRYTYRNIGNIGIRTYVTSMDHDVTMRLAVNHATSGAGLLYTQKIFRTCTNAIFHSKEIFLVASIYSVQRFAFEFRKSLSGTASFDNLKQTFL